MKVEKLKPKAIVIASGILMGILGTLFLYSALANDLNLPLKVFTETKSPSSSNQAFIYLIGLTFIIVPADCFHNIFNTTLDENGISTTSFFRKRKILWKDIKWVNEEYFMGKVSAVVFKNEDKSNTVKFTVYSYKNSENLIHCCRYQLSLFLTEDEKLEISD